MRNAPEIIARPAPTISSPGVHKLFLSEDLFTLVDTADIEDVSRFSWRPVLRSNGAGYYAVRTYSKGNGLRRKVHAEYLHRRLLCAPAAQLVDHINGDGLDNRRLNLRFCSQSGNARNRRANANATSRFKGIYARNARWAARIKVDSRDIHLGVFGTDLEAARAYDAAALKYFGEFACLNFPTDPLLPRAVDQSFVPAYLSNSEARR